ncbi:hypothetical protein LXA43DRAFT_1065285 [Ganoderma leucocontextum]|nr:hypothetical protein LXA43DRAFT_1065285 [Ganoderma leucocontextum]
MSRYHVVDLQLENGSKYSPGLRTLCHIDAKQRLVFPATCPRCSVPNTSFKIFMTYTADKAGLWSVFVHTPEQEGPSEDVRRLIQERIQHEAAERKAAEKPEQRVRKANASAMNKLLKKEKKAMRDADKREKAKKQAELAARRAHKRDAAHLEHLRDVREGVPKSRKKNTSKEMAIAIPRLVELSLWTKNDADPLIAEVEVADASSCDVPSIPQVAQGLQAGHVAEHWEVDDARWTPGIAPADVRRGAPVLLVRDSAVTRCLKFGFHVHLLQDGAASTAKGRKEGLKAARAVRNEVSARVGLAVEAWVVLWSKDECRAEVFRLPLDAKRRVRLTADASVRAALENTDAVHVWSLRDTDWKEHGVDDAIPVRNYDTILVRVPDVEGLKFFGVELEQLSTRDVPILGLNALGNVSRVTRERTGVQSLPGDLATPLLGSVPGTLDIFY